MRIGLNLPHYGSLTSPEAVSGVSRAAEDLGFDSLWTGDRILAPLRPTDRYPGGDGVMPAEMVTYLDPLTALAFAAAGTSRIRLGTSTLNAPWYPPVLLARTLTTLDVLSRGRLDVGLGLGWQRDEYAAVGVPWSERGARLDETLDVLEKIWGQEVVAHEGAAFRVAESRILPKPAQRPRPPILLAGLTPRAMSRIARRADGWLAVGLPLPYLRALRQQARTEAEAAGRDPGALRVVQRLNPRLSGSPADPARVPATGTLRQIADYAKAAAADEVFVDLSLTVSSEAEMLDVAGTFLELMRAG
ncbi:TIGR03619 family F420-dependent LLM class oxidoreductase [Pseudosporangium ferrugineum]|uniref:Putative F420-dependent oxidoreductase n=1 Tax=Pseudosporangium ferrugineum TaxID=439699 RepID=A0A2T0SJ87_9ACTN|nr:TIGR03619 family F420-dependent LLM class oxidoreductase [Pseudosporangium ferrugineum]PRY33468.1 putative F420-dependent oxidoreductase [Pseudosporangium ferrugineum]